MLCLCSIFFKIFHIACMSYRIRILYPCPYFTDMMEDFFLVIVSFIFFDLRWLRLETLFFRVVSFISILKAVGRLETTRHAIQLADERTKLWGFVVFYYLEEHEVTSYGFCWYFLPTWGADPRGHDVKWTPHPLGLTYTRHGNWCSCSVMRPVICLITLIAWKIKKRLSGYVLHEIYVKWVRSKTMFKISELVSIPVDHLW